MIAGPLGPTTVTTASFRFTGSVPGGSFECQFDGGPWTDCASGQTYPGLGLGPHSFLVRQTDDAGNVGAPATQTFTVGLTADVRRPSRVWTVMSARPEVQGGVVPVGCRLDRGSLQNCTIRVYSVAKHGHRVMVGTGKVAVATPGLPLAGVNIALSAAGRRLLSRTLGGVPVVFASVAHAFGLPGTLTANNVGRLFPPSRTVIPTDGLFNFNSSAVLAKGRRFLHSIALHLSNVQSIVCIGHTDDVGSRAYNYRLGLRRARGVCQMLLAAPTLRGAPATVRSYGKLRPRASNATVRGRHLNRFVELIVNYRNLN